MPPILKTVHHDPRTSAGCLFLAPLSGPGPARRDDRRRQRRARLVPPRARRGDELPRRHLQRQARAHLVGGQDDAAASATGTHVIVDDSYREIARVPAGRRPAVRPARVPAHAARHRARHVAARRVRRTCRHRRPAQRRRRRAGSSRSSSSRAAVCSSSGAASTTSRSASRTRARIAQPFDYFHVNSIESTATATCSSRRATRGRSTRSTAAPGEVIWRLGGKQSDFAMGPGRGFAWQHDARRHGGGDDLIESVRRRLGAAGPAAVERLVLALDSKRMHATLVPQVHPRPAAARARARQHAVLPNGNVLVGWGTAAVRHRVHAPTARSSSTRTCRTAAQNYRALRDSRGSAGRRDPPTLAAAATRRPRCVYASWNGATEVASWRLDSGASPRRSPR